MTPESFSYWENVGFILNGRRFLVWWQHPRDVFRIDLVAPVEVQNERELADMAALASELVLRQATLAERFSGATYGRVDWLRDVQRMRS